MATQAIIFFDLIMLESFDRLLRFRGRFFLTAVYQLMAVRTILPALEMVKMPLLFSGFRLKRSGRVTNASMATGAKPALKIFMAKIGLGQRGKELLVCVAEVANPYVAT